ncbi:hypothetical protein [Methylobacter sp.]|uniref:hypothetical protein n=1 Tax=Methylobacter sp. TaxID=2051955 RepID=UPI001214E312|nr:hypothetical protein [Methylobacter sp.]TAK64122.1 MAG: hypothetical protein EPO18_04140 [Methylobacter sp.]
MRAPGRRESAGDPVAALITRHIPVPRPCMGETEAARIAEAEQLKVLLIYDADNKLTEHMSKAFATSQ